MIMHEHMSFTEKNYCLFQFGWLGIVLYAPSLALSQGLAHHFDIYIFEVNSQMFSMYVNIFVAVSGMPVWIAITSIGIVCTFYTTLVTSN